MFNVFIKGGEEKRRRKRQQQRASLRTKEVARWLWAPAALTTDLGSVPSTLVATQVLASKFSRHTHDTHTYTCKYSRTHIK